MTSKRTKPDTYRQNLRRCLDMLLRGGYSTSHIAQETSMFPEQIDRTRVVVNALWEMGKLEMEREA